jgi:hypothetical protein
MVQGHNAGLKVERGTDIGHSQLYIQHTPTSLAYIVLFSIQVLDGAPPLPGIKNSSPIGERASSLIFAKIIGGLV